MINENSKDDLLEKEAWGIYKEALKASDLPKNIKVDEINGKLRFTITMLSNDAGIGFFQYYPPTSVIKEFLSGKHYLSSPFRHPEIDRGMALKVASLWLENFHIEIRDSFFSLHEIPTYMLDWSLFESFTHFSETNQSSAKPEAGAKPLANPKTLLEDFLNERKQKTKKRIVDELETNRKWSNPVSNLLAHYYDKLKPKWQKAAKCYKAVKKVLDDWESAVAREYPDLPPDLIKRLGDIDSYQSSAWIIALEHSARECGFPKNSLDKDALVKRVQKSREWMENNGKAFVKVEIAQFEFYKSEMSKLVKDYALSVNNQLRQTTDENFDSQFSGLDENTVIH